MLRGRRIAGVDFDGGVRPARDLSRPRQARRAFAGGFRRGLASYRSRAATMRMPIDELALIAALAGRAAGRGEMRDQRPAACRPTPNYILEGYLDEHGHVEPEGPYGEFLGYYGGVKRNPVFHLTAITHRRDALFQTATISGANMAHTDTALLCALRTEAMVWRALRNRRSRGQGASMPRLASGGMFNVRVAMQQRVPGEARNAIAAVFASLANVKHVFVVDPDIDIFSDAQMEWALATRFQADRDLVVQRRNARQCRSTHRSRRDANGAKAGFDLTLPLLAPGTVSPWNTVIPAPPVFDNGIGYTDYNMLSLDAALS